MQPFTPATERPRTRTWARPIRVARTAITALLTTTALTVVGAGAAHADIWQLQDGFEIDRGNWTLFHEGTGSGGYEVGAGTARSGSANAWLRAETGWSSVGRSVRITPYRYGPTCGAGFALQGPAGTQVNVEVIQPSDWTYLALETVTLNSSGYATFSSPAWKGGPETVFVRASLLANGSSWVRVDDMIVQCWGYYSS